MSEILIPEPRFVSLYGMYIVGWEVRTSNRDEGDPAKAKIPGVWERAREEEIIGQISNAKDPDVLIGAYTRYLSDDKGPYSLIVGAEVADLDDVPKGMTGITVLAQEYVVFTASGEVPQAVMDGWAAVWKYFSETTALTRAFTTDFEKYDSGKPGEVEIHIAVR
jgi:predicted transcriptional regulator YdeE